MYRALVEHNILYTVTIEHVESLLNRKLAPDEIDLVKQGLTAGLDSVLETTLHAALEARPDKEEQ